MTILFWLLFALACCSAIAWIVSMVTKRFMLAIVMALSLSVCSLGMNIINIILK